MERFGKALFWCCMVGYVSGTLALVVGGLALKAGNKDIAAIAWGSAGVVILLAMIMGKIANHISRKVVAGITRAMNDMHITLTEEDQHPWLDSNKLRKWTWDLHSLGFRTLGDCTLSTAGLSTKALGISEPFTRVLANEKDKCFAEICQTCRPKDGPREMTCSVYTVFTSGNQLRTNSSNATEGDHAVAFQMVLDQHPGASPGDLLRYHIKTRQDYMNQHNETIREGFSFDAYQQQVEEMTRKAKDYISSKIQQVAGGEDVL